MGTQMTASDGFWYETDLDRCKLVCTAKVTRENSNCTQEQFKYKPSPKFN